MSDRIDGPAHRAEPAAGPGPEGATVAEGRTQDPVRERAGGHDPVYDRLHETAEFAELRRRYRAFAFPATAAFLAWYLLYVVMSNWASGFMSTKLLGNINVALVFGVLQFATTFVLAYLYSRYSTSKLDPLARQLEADYATGGRGGARR